MRLRILLYTLTIVCLLGFRIPDLISPPLDKPFLKQPSTQIETKKIEKLEAVKNRNAEEEYELGLLYILSGNIELAKKHINQALQLKPSFQYAEIQLAYIYLWEQEIQLSAILFDNVLKKTPCQWQALYGKALIAKDQNKQEMIEAIQLIQKCPKINSDTLFLLGQLYYRTGQIKEAKITFIKVLDQAPQYEDAAEALAQIYRTENDSKSLKVLTEKYPSNTRIQHLYAQQLIKYQRFQEANKIYQKLTTQDVLLDEFWSVKSRTNPAISLEATYTDAKESDPTLRKPVVKDYYFYTAFNAYIPIFNQWRIDTKGFLYHQRENDILPPVGVNYNIYESGGQITSHYYFAPDWKWDVTARVFNSWGKGHMTYPFQNTTRFEPGTSLIYNAEHLFILDAHIESFIIKNYQIEKSQLMRTDYYQTVYGYRPDVFLHPRIEASAGWINFHDSFHNWKNRQTVSAHLDLYYPSLTIMYLFEHAHFNHLNENYFSYKQQLRNTLQVKFYKEFHSKFYFQAFWDHIWEDDYNLYLPIGNFVYVASKLYLIWNTIDAAFGYRYKDLLKIEMGGHYLHNTLPYTDWNLRGSIIWQF